MKPVLANCVAVFGTLLIATGIHAETVPQQGALDHRIRSAPYSPDEVYRLHGYVGYQIDLQFEPGEQFVGMGAGDIEGLSFVAQDHHLFLKPKVASIGTNLTLLTNKRHYQVDYTATWKRPDFAVDDVVFAVKFIYTPEPARVEDTAPEEIDAALASAATARSQNIDYWYCGHPSLRPMTTFDDGVHTWLTFASSAELPALFVRQDDGSESLLNFSMEEGTVVIHRVAQRFILRRGKLTGCIVNQAWQATSQHLNTQTVSPRVDRITTGEAP